ncbi:MAG: ATP-binding protein [Desulfurivibrionaceae bacterium]
MRSLKIQTALTFLLLLVIGMLLVELVAMQLWRRDALRADRKQAELLLDAMAMHIFPGAERGGNVASLELPASDGAVLCFGMLDAEGRVVVSPQCGFAQPLEEGLRLVATSGKAYRRMMPSKNRGQPGGILLLAQPVRADGEASPGAVGMIRSLAPLEAQLRDGETTILGYVLVNGVLLAALGLFRIIKLVVRPLENLAEQADLYSAQHEFLPSSGRRRNEFGRLESSLHRMVAKLEQDREDLRKTVQSLEQANTQLENTRQEMVRAEKQASTGRLAAGLAHEIGNPLGVMQGYLELLREEGLAPGERKEFLDRTEQELGRVNRLIRQLLDFARPAPGNRVPVHGQQLAQQAVEMFRERGKGVITYDATLRAEQDLVVADPDGLRQVLVNCLLNAEDALLSGPASGKTGRIEVLCKNCFGPNGSPALRVTVRDNGPGIAPEHLADVFEPFFTTKEPGKGTGLGLSVSSGLIAGFGGEMGVVSQPGEGAEIWFSLPLLAETPAGDKNCAQKSGTNQNG